MICIDSLGVVTCHKRVSTELGVVQTIAEKGITSLLVIQICTLDPSCCAVVAANVSVGAVACVMDKRMCLGCLSKAWAALATSMAQPSD